MTELADVLRRLRRLHARRMTSTRPRNHAAYRVETDVRITGSGDAVLLALIVSEVHRRTGRRALDHELFNIRARDEGSAVAGLVNALNELLASFPEPLDDTISDAEVDGLAAALLAGHWTGGGWFSPPTRGTKN